MYFLVLLGPLRRMVGGAIISSAGSRITLMRCHLAANTLAYFLEEEKEYEVCDTLRSTFTFFHCSEAMHLWMQWSGLEES